MLRDSGSIGAENDPAHRLFKIKKENVLMITTISVGIINWR
jgi:hypothetical protein